MLSSLSVWGTEYRNLSMRPARRVAMPTGLRRQLSDVDLPACRALAAQLQRIRRLEDQAAAAAGLSAIFAEDDRCEVQQ